jgi:hypothetical protein
VLVAFERGTRSPGHRPILEQALDADDRAIATKRLNPWDYGGTEPPPPPLDGAGSTLLASISTSAGQAELRISAPGRGWERRQCWGVVLDRLSTPIVCGYPAGFDPRVAAPATNNLFLPGPSVRGLVIAMATRIEDAWLVSAGGGVRPGRIVRLELAGDPQVIVLAATGSGRGALTGIVTSRGGQIVGALLVAGRGSAAPGGATPPCFLAAPSAGAPATTPACRTLMEAARRRFR